MKKINKFNFKKSQIFISQKIPLKIPKIVSQTSNTQKKVLKSQKLVISVSTKWLFFLSELKQRKRTSVESETKKKDEERKPEAL